MVRIGYVEHLVKYTVYTLWKYFLLYLQETNGTPVTALRQTLYISGVFHTSGECCTYVDTVHSVGDQPTSTESGVVLPSDPDNSTATASPHSTTTSYDDMPDSSELDESSDMSSSDSYEGPDILKPGYIQFEWIKSLESVSLVVETIGLCLDFE